MLLPSPQMVELSERFAICLSGKRTPKGCDVRYRQFYWLMVFDREGELRHACRLGDELTAGMKEGLGVADAFVEAVDAAYKKPMSLQQAQRAYLRARGTDASFAALQQKLVDLQRVGQLQTAALLASEAGQTADPTQSKARALRLEADACSHQVINHAAFARLRGGITAFLQEHPAHEASPGLVDLLLEVGMKYSFDVEAQCAALSAPWANGEATPDHRRLADLLVARSRAVVAAARRKLEDMEPDDYGYVRFLAACGEAQATLDALAKEKSYGVFRPIHAEWRRDAQQKLQGAR